MTTWRDDLHMDVSDSVRKCKTSNGRKWALHCVVSVLDLSACSLFVAWNIFCGLNTRTRKYWVQNDWMGCYKDQTSPVLWNRFLNMVTRSASRDQEICLAVPTMLLQRYPLCAMQWHAKCLKRPDALLLVLKEHSNPVQPCAYVFQSGHWVHIANYITVVPPSC